ncbi:MAG: 3-dehydroquinate dehydratase [Saprospiraceae bacterium]|nr:3-dehydroquinate dehydratase [Saprospiraceae bacterium]HRG69626.1 type II 3-dehydroquinate dehydratase [Saprospiraceae bacterium]
MWTIPIIHGPNLNLTGEREPNVYGNQTFEHFFEELVLEFPNLNLSYHQSNLEGQLVDWLQSYRNSADAIILNPAAYTHTSIAIRDAVAALKIPVVEVHISAIHSREDFRKQSLIKELCLFNIHGFGLNGYRMALLRLSEFLNVDPIKPIHK